MASDATARGMLTIYRQNLDKFTASQLEQFKKMTAQERMELLFLMIINTNKGLQFVHSLVDPVGVETQRMSDAESVN